MKECPKCGHKYADEVRICPRCKHVPEVTGIRPGTATTVIKSFGIDALETPGEERPYLLSGTVIGSYRIEELLGKGGMGEVYCAIHTTLGRKFALKLLRSSFSWERDAIRRFYLEARAASQVQHPNIVSITDFIESEEGEFCYVMEYLEGEALNQRLDRGALSLEETLDIAVQIGMGLEALHNAGVIHRDLKPPNVFLARQAREPVRVKLLDFGIIKLSQDSKLVKKLAKGTGHLRLMGTPDYMSPEQVQALATLDHRADIYSFGVILYEMLSGRRPLLSPSTGELLQKVMVEKPLSPSDLTEAEIPPPLERLIMRCLEKDPDDRPETVGEVVEVLRETAAAVRDAREAPRRRRRAILLLLGLFMMASSALVYILWPAPQVVAPALEQPIATLARKWRTVTRRPRESVKWEPARVKMDLYRLDAVRTGLGAEAVVRFNRGGSLTIRLFYHGKGEHIGRPFLSSILPVQHRHMFIVCEQDAQLLVMTFQVF